MAQEIVSNTDRQLFTNTDLANLVVWNPRTDKETLRNETGSEVTLEAGLILGRKTSGTHAGKLAPYDSTDTEGANVPVYILGQTVTIAANSDASNVMVYLAGDVNTSKLIFSNGSDDLTTIAGGVMVKDALNSGQFVLKNVTELSEYDNS